MIGRVGPFGQALAYHEDPPLRQPTLFAVPPDAYLKRNEFPQFCRQRAIHTEYHELRNAAKAAAERRRQRACLHLRSSADTKNSELRLVDDQRLGLIGRQIQCATGLGGGVADIEVGGRFDSLAETFHG